MLMFFTNGAVMAGLMPRYPELKESLGLSNGAFGLLVASVAVGSLLASNLPGVAIRRFGARRTTTIGTVVMALVMAAVGFSPTAVAVALLLAGMGFLDAVVDAAQNVHGLRVERGLGKTVINSMHASWSVGAALGGFGAALAAGAGLPLGLHLALNGLVVAAAAVLAYRLAAPPGEGVTARAKEPSGKALPDRADSVTADHAAGEEAWGDTVADAPEDGVSSSHAVPAASDHADPVRSTPARPGLRAWMFLVVLPLMAVAGAMIEDVGNNWSANFLHQDAGLSTAVAGYGYVVLLVSQFVGRILGDVLTDRLGRDLVALLGGLCIAAGFALVMIAPGAVTGFAAFALAGFGCATLIPAAYAEADKAPDFKDGSGITVVGWIMRAGFLGTSPVVGAIADATSLRVAFLVPMAAGLGVVVISAWLMARARRRTAATA